MERDRRETEVLTAELFHKIHQKATFEDLERYRATVQWLLEGFSRVTGIETSNILEDKDVLEVGCGGRASGVYALKVYRPKNIKAIDLSNENVYATTAICDNLGYGNVDVQTGNALNLNFSDASFDFVFSNGVIHHTEDPYRCFLEICRVLKPGGHVLLGIYGYGGVWGKIIHPTGMLLGRLIPLKLTERFVNATGLMRSQDRSLLDWLYAPIQKKYRLSEIFRWFADNQLDTVVSLGSPKRHYRMGILTRILFGDGYIYVIGRKV